MFHIDELAQVEFKTKKKWTLIQFPDSLKAGLHYVVQIASKKAIAENREAVIRYLVGWIQTQKFMSSTSPADIKEFAKIAADASQIDVEVAENSIKAYQGINYWVNNDGLDERQLMAQVDDLVRVGLMKAENKPSYNKIVDGRSTRKR